LRRISGVDVDDFAQRTGFQVEDLGGAALKRHIELGLLEGDEKTLRLTREGLFVSDSLWPYYVRT
jgi:coproporphyrinogen III oxidase-like Fe-S oxidoreductase